jgi:TonB family protein
VQGTVKVAGRVGPDGYVSDVHILESPHTDLSEIATRYVASMRYEPTKVQGTPMSTELVLTIDFRAQR